MSFLVDEVVRLNDGDALFAGRLELDRINVSGIWSSGMVVEACRTNSQAKCAAIWDATNLQLNSAGLQKPFLAALSETAGFYSETYGPSRRPSPTPHCSKSRAPCTKPAATQPGPFSYRQAVHRRWPSMPVCSGFLILTSRAKRSSFQLIAKSTT